MVFRYFLGNLLRETAQDKWQEMTEDAKAAAEKHAATRCDLLVATALPIEAGGLVDKLSDVSVLTGRGYTERIGRFPTSTEGDSLVVGIVETGPGADRAARAITAAIAARKPQWVVSTGFAGGLREGIERGHYLMADEIVRAASGEQLAVGLTMDKEALAASPGVHVGRLLTVDHIVRDPDEKRRLGERHDALACDMESYAVAAACTEAKTRFLAVRIVSDAVNETLPKEISKLMDQKSSAAQFGAAAAALWNRPSSAKDLWKLKEDALQASDRLAKFLVGVIRQLPLEATSSLPSRDEENKS